MKTLTTITALFAAALILTPLTSVAQGQGRGAGAQPQDRAQVERGQRDLDRDRLRDRDRLTAPERDRDRIQDQDRTNAPDSAKKDDQDIYGSKLMSVEERNQYREQLRLFESDPEKQTQFKAQHQEKMQARAKAQGVPFEDLGETEEAE